MNLSRRNFTGLTIITSGAALLAACGGAATGPNATGGTGTAGAPGAKAAVLTIASGVEPQSLDPAKSREAQFVQYFQPMFDTIIRRLPDGKIGPMIATKWEFSADNKAITFTLRDDITFSDGTKLDAAAVKANLDRFVTAGGPLQAALSTMASTEVASPTSLIIKLKDANPAFLNTLGGPGGYVQSPANFDKPTIDTVPIGSGPYLLDRTATTPGSQYTFIKNAKYWDPTIQKFEKIIIKPIKDENARLNAVRSGQADVMIATAKTVDAAKAGGLTVHLQPGDWQGMSLFDRDGKITPALAKVEVRQAINYAIDKEAILKNVIRGMGEVTSQIFSPSSPAYVKELDTAYTYDPAKAKALLAAAGLEAGFELKMPSSSDMDPALAPVIRDQLAKVNIKVTWVDVATPQYQAEQQSGKYSAAFTPFGTGPVSWGAVIGCVLPTSPWNVFKTTTPEIAQLIAAVQTSKPADSQADEQALNKYLVDNAWFSPWYRVNQPYYSGKNVKVTLQSGQPVPSIYNFEPAS